MAVSIGSIVQLAIKYGPRLGSAVAALIAFLAKNPELPEKIRGYLGTLLKQIVVIYSKGGDAAKIEGILGLVRDAARRLSASDASSARMPAADWLKRADNLDVALKLAIGLSQPQKRQTLAKLRTRAEELLAEVLEAASGSTAP